MARAVWRGFLWGAGIGGLFGLLFGLIGLFEEQGAGLALLFYTVGIGGIAGLIVGIGAHRADRSRFRLRRRW